jgi:hypothetical protein
MFEFALSEIHWRSSLLNPRANLACSSFNWATLIRNERNADNNKTRHIRYIKRMGTWEPKEREIDYSLTTGIARPLSANFPGFYNARQKYYLGPLDEENLCYNRIWGGLNGPMIPFTQFLRR